MITLRAPATRTTDLYEVSIEAPGYAENGFIIEAATAVEAATMFLDKCEAGEYGPFIAGAVRAARETDEAMLYVTAL